MVLISTSKVDTVERCHCFVLDLALMRRCACIPGIHTFIVVIVGSACRDDGAPHGCTTCLGYSTIKQALAKTSKESKASGRRQSTESKVSNIHRTHTGITYCTAVSTHWIRIQQRTSTSKQHIKKQRIKRHPPRFTPHLTSPLLYLRFWIKIYIT